MQNDTTYSHIISLGRNCLPRVILTHSGYKPRKAQGELTLPFDLSIHSYENVCSLIENDFKFYIDANFIEIKEEKIVHTYYKGVEFPHESGAKYIEFFSKNNFEELVKKFQKRVENFYAYIADNDILFVCNFSKYPKELAQVIKTKFPELRFKIVCLNYIPNLDLPSQRLINIMLPNGLDINPLIDYYVLIPPEKNFKWNNARLKETLLGKRFYGQVDNIFKRYMLKN